MQNKQLIEAIVEELYDLTEEINKINFGEVLIEIKHGQVQLITYKGEKRPGKVDKNLELLLTKSTQFDKIPL